MRSEQGLIGWIVLIFLILIIIFGGLLLLNSYGSIPGDSSYLIKKLTENLKLSINDLSFEGRARVYLEMSQERLSELQQLVKMQDRNKEIIETIDRLQDQQTKAVTNIERARSKGTNVTELLNTLEANLQNQQTVFPELTYQVVGPAIEALQKALASSNETLSRVEYLKSAQR